MGWPGHGGHSSAAAVSQTVKTKSITIAPGCWNSEMCFDRKTEVSWPLRFRISSAKGFNSALWGFLAIGVFMCAYYALFGVVSTIALASNLLLLVALLSLLQATLTLPGIAPMALTLGMAIDANVLINERIREELRNGSSPQAAIAAGYDRAFDTILDSNITTLIAGVALLVFGSGPVRGFAVVHCLGILTSMFSAVLVSRMMINLIYGRQRKVEKLAIGQVWKPGNN